MKLVRTSGVALAAVCLLLSGCFGKKKINPQDTQGAPVSDSVAPDKVLYQHAMDDINHSHFEVARLTLQSLINTYPDSEYLAKAKMALADSYYKEGGNTGLSQAVLEYKGFITFFPFLTDECAYAQMQIGMAHYRRIEKSDRDRSESEASEEEFQLFLQKYPSSTLVPQVDQYLRNVQELLADGDFKIAQYYYTKGAYRAAAGRLLEVASRYPLYSNSDKSLMMLAGIYERNEKTQYAGLFYSRLVRDYPLSPYLAEAKQHLTKLGLPIPAPDPEAMARMKKEQQMPHPRETLMAKALSPIQGRPNLTAAAQTGDPQMNPPDESADLESLVKGSGFNLSASGGGANASSGAGSSGSTSAEGTTAGSSGNSGAAAGATDGTATTGAGLNTPTNGTAVQIVTPGQNPTPGPAANTPAGSAPGTAAPAGTAAGTAENGGNASGSAPAGGTPTAADVQNGKSANCPPAKSSNGSSGSSNGSSGNSSGSTASTNGNQAKTSQQGCPAPQKKKKHWPW